MIPVSRAVPSVRAVPSPQYQTRGGRARPTRDQQCHRAAVTGAGGVGADLRPSWDRAVPGDDARLLRQGARPGPPHPSSAAAAELAPLRGRHQRVGRPTDRAAPARTLNGRQENDGTANPAGPGTTPSPGDQARGDTPCWLSVANTRISAK